MLLWVSMVARHNINLGCSTVCRLGGGLMLKLKELGNARPPTCAQLHARLMRLHRSVFSLVAGGGGVA
jgi:hypothetical protein